MKSFFKHPKQLKFNTDFEFSICIEFFSMYIKSLL